MDILKPLNSEELVALLMRCQMVLDYKQGKSFTAENLCALISAELNADRSQQFESLKYSIIGEK